MDRQNHVRTMSKAAACALIALCSATGSLSAADDNPRPDFVNAQRMECEESEGEFAVSEDGLTTACCDRDQCMTCTIIGTSQVCMHSCKSDLCCALGDGTCDWMTIYEVLVVAEPEDESGRPSFEELQADDSLVVVDEGGPSTLIDEFEFSVGDFTPVADSSDDLEEYTPIGDSEEFVWQYTPIGDSEEYIWAYTPIGYEMEEIPQNILDTLRDQARDFELQADEGESVVETSDESTPEQDTTNPGARRRSDRSRRDGGRNY